MHEQGFQNGNFQGNGGGCMDPYQQNALNMQHYQQGRNYGNHNFGQNFGGPQFFGPNPSCPF